jgi:UDP-N-acetylglucosamine--N-acetylmuramyl-(pentapeptide) pyrophosphoryl-undecaprenol N-acetylglucosamine transferase
MYNSRLPQNASPRRIAVAGGFTAGHILPALELLRAYQDDHGAQGFFIGCPHGMETRLVVEAGLRLETIPGAPIARQSVLAQLNGLYSLARGILAGRALLRRERTQLVIGFGSYASTGACLAAWSLGVPVVLHESNAALGKANRLLFGFARRVCVAFDSIPAHARVVRTGTPCRPAAPPVPSPDGRLRVLVMGGSQGSPHLNQEAPKLLAAVHRHRPLRVVHLTGDADPASVERAYRHHAIEARVERYTAAMPALYAESDFVIACAGGGCLAEIASYALPALLVPLSQAAGNHQADNAREFGRQTGCLWVSEEAWEAEAQAERMLGLLETADGLRQVRGRAAVWAVPDAAQRVIAVCEEVLAVGAAR